MTGSSGGRFRSAALAAIQAAKQTSHLIPLCHPLPLTKVAVRFEIDGPACAVQCTVQAETVGRTGVEMEALTAVTVAALTIYDMCKAVQKDIEITDIRLESKTGGKSDYNRG